MLEVLVDSDELSLIFYIVISVLVSASYKYIYYGSGSDKSLQK